MYSSTAEVRADLAKTLKASHDRAPVIVTRDNKTFNVQFLTIDEIVKGSVANTDKSISYYVDIL